jgi:plasmid stabilization system protein ParE
VRRVRILATARSDIAAIYRYIEGASGSVVVAKRFTRLLTEQCRRLGRLPGTVGRPRPELEPGIRSFPFKNYIIFMRYVGNTLEIINVIEGHRDMDAIFRRNDDDRT